MVVTRQFTCNRKYESGVYPLRMREVSVNGPSYSYGTGLASAGHEKRNERLVALLVQAIVVLVGLDLTVAKGFSAAFVALIVLTPVWLPAIRTYRSVMLILILAPIALLAGYLLSMVSAKDHLVDTSLQLRWSALILSGLAAMIGLLWARRLVPLHRVVLLLGIGAVAHAVLFTEMSWKYDLVEPLTYVVLGLVERFRSRLIPAAVVLVMGLIGVINEGRSFFAFCVVAAMATLWQIRPRGERTESNPWYPVVLLAGSCAAVYWSISTLLTRGVFGTTLQERSVEQIQSSGSLLAGGRPEWAATRELMKQNPMGFGTGVVPGWSDLQAGRAGLASINIDAGGYTTNYLFGGGFELHSIVSDLWVTCGIAGLAFAAVVIFAILRSLSSQIAARQAATSVLFACSIALWALLFGPIFSNWIDVGVALGLVLILRKTPADSASVDQSDKGTVAAST